MAAYRIRTETERLTLVQFRRVPFIIIEDFSAKFNPISCIRIYGTSFFTPASLSFFIIFATVCLITHWLCLTNGLKTPWLL